MKKVLAIIIGLVAVGLIAGIVIANQPEDTPAPVPASNSSSANNQASSEADSADSEPQTFTAAEVATHSSADDCWMIIRDSVYDVTSFVASHPGGDEILRGCGRDATTLFESRQTDEGERVGSGIPHSATAENMLQSFKIGEL